jgi:hypothetical protein
MAQEGHVKRMNKERGQLEDRMRKLLDFIYGNPIYTDLTKIQKDLITKQLGYMQEYMDVLSLRIYLEKQSITPD